MIIIGYITIVCSFFINTPQYDLSQIENFVDQGDINGLSGLLKNWACNSPRTFAIPKDIPKDFIKQSLYNAFNSLPTSCPLEGFFRISEELYPLLSMNWEKEWLSSEIMIRIRMLPITYVYPFSKNSIVFFRILAHRILRNRLLTGVPQRTDESNLFKLQAFLGLSTPFPNTVPWRVLVLLPLTGKYAPLGRQVLYGLLASSVKGLQLIIVDTKSSPSEALKKAMEISSSSFPIVIIGPPDKPSIRVLASQPWTRPIIFPTSPIDGIPRDTGALFFSRPAPLRRVYALVFQSLKFGAQNFCLLAPNNTYGKKMGLAFNNALTSLNNKLLYSHYYDRKNLPLKFIIPKSCDTVFIPESGRYLGLIARRIAASGRFPGPLRFIIKKRKRVKQGLLILSTAEGILPSHIQKAYRYLQDALLAPGFLAFEPILDSDERNMLKLLNKNGIDRVISPAYEAFLLFKQIYTIIYKGSETAQELLQGLQKLPMAPGQPPMFDNKGRSLRSIKVYRVVNSGVEVIYK